MHHQETNKHPATPTQLYHCVAGTRAAPPARFGGGNKGSKFKIKNEGKSKQSNQTGDPARDKSNNSEQIGDLLMANLKIVN
jgi:hypothetical protein